eukprot:jgi/Mesvir1/11288/Mv01082-RA.1
MWRTLAFLAALTYLLLGVGSVDGFVHPKGQLSFAGLEHEGEDASAVVRGSFHWTDFQSGASRGRNRKVTVETSVPSSPASGLHAAGDTGGAIRGQLRALHSGFEIVGPSGFPSLDGYGRPAWKGRDILQVDARVQARLEGSPGSSAAVIRDQGLVADVASMHSRETQMPELVPASHPDGTPGAHLLFFVGVLSAPQNQAQRDAIRRTWFRYSPGTWGRAFFLGRAPYDSATNAAAEEESERHGDIVFVKMNESYADIGKKVLGIFRYASSGMHNGQAYRYILKADDDCFLRVPQLFPIFEHLPAEGVYWGRDPVPGRGWLPIRDPNSKWYVSKEQYMFDEGPPFASGVLYGLSNDLAQHVVKVSKSPLIHTNYLEDVSIAHLVATSSTFQGKIFSFEGIDVAGNGCDERFISLHYVAPAAMMKMHRVSAPYALTMTKMYHVATH